VSVASAGFNPAGSDDACQAGLLGGFLLLAAVGKSAAIALYPWLERLPTEHTTCSQVESSLETCRQMAQQSSLTNHSSAAAAAAAAAALVLHRVFSWLLPGKRFLHAMWQGWLLHWWQCQPPVLWRAANHQVWNCPRRKRLHHTARCGIRNRPFHSRSLPTKYLQCWRQPPQLHR
jgi:hypothetical protein